MRPVEEIGPDRRTYTVQKLYFVLEDVGPDGKLRTRAYRADQCRWFQVVDTALTVGEHSNYTVVGTFVLTEDRDLLVWDIFRDKIEVPKQYGTIIAQRSKSPQRLLFQAIENKGSGIGLIQQGAADNFPFRPLNPWGDKAVRAATASQLYENGRIFHKAGADWLTVFETELMTFPTGANDDCADCLAYSAQLAVEDKLLNMPLTGALTLNPHEGDYERRLIEEEKVVTVGGHQVVFEDQGDQWWSR
jgi:predicted phage terminase large subunit-like protein